jgi:CHASE2 domain-containing sensor protein
MDAHDDAGRTATRAISVAAIALAGLALSVLALTARLDSVLLDMQWQLLRRFDVRQAPNDIVIVGVDEASVAAIPEPPGLWHATLGRALTRLASAKPRAIGLELALPERSFDGIKPGLDRALFDGLANAVESAPFVTVLSIDARTRGARNIHKPFLALLGESRLGIGLTARDADGVARRFSLVVPTEDGGFPSFEGRLCRALKHSCADGLINYALGDHFKYIPLKTLLVTDDKTVLEQAFRDRIVLIGEALPFTDRIEVPVNLAGWERGGRDSPGIVVHAQALRTALAGEAPQEASRPLTLLLLSLAALAFLVRDARHAALAALLVAAGIFAVAVASLRGGVHLPVAPILVTLALALAARLGVAWRTHRKP